VTEIAPQLDLLTGAWNRDFFEIQLARAVSRSHRAKSPLALLYLDVDELQEHNDVHGAVAVDSALAWVAAQISEAVDGQGPISRVDGGAFAVFLSDFTLQRALRLAEQVRERISRTKQGSAFPGYHLTVSVGVAALRRGEPCGNLLEAAEQACRKAKQGGRDSVAQR